MSAAASLPMLTIEDVASKTGINLERLEQECSDSDLLYLSEFCDPWKLIGQHLQLTDPQIRAIDSDHKTTEEKRLASLRKWKENKAFGATFKVFVDALLACKFARKARKVCEYRLKQGDSCVSGGAAFSGNSETTSSVHSEQSASDLHHEQVPQLQTRQANDESSGGRYEKLSDQVIDVASRYRLHSHDGTSRQTFQTKQKGFNCSFTSKNPLTCPLCRCILRKPHTVQCCKQNFCEFCISRVQEKGGRCPKCKSNIVHHPIANKVLEGALLQFEVYCTNKCGWKGPLKEHDSHINFDPSDNTWLDGCKKVIVQCIYCRSKSIERKYLLQRLEYRFPESKVDSVVSITRSVGVCAKWHDIGMELGLEITVLQTIRVLHPQNKHEECYRGMLKEWIESSEGANWKNLLDVFRKPTVNLECLATKIEQALLCDKAYDLRVNELTEKINECVMSEQKTTMNSNLIEKTQELQKLQEMTQKKGEKNELGFNVEKYESEKMALIEHIQEVEFQLKDIRDTVKEYQKLLQDQIIELEFEKNVKLQEHGLGKPLKAHYKEYNITRAGMVACLIGGTAVLVFHFGVDFCMEMLLVLLLVLTGAGYFTIFIEWPMVKLMVIIGYCITKRWHKNEKKHIDDQYARLIQMCYDKMEAIQPMTQECEEQIVWTH